MRRYIFGLGIIFLPYPAAYLYRLIATRLRTPSTPKMRNSTSKITPGLLVLFNLLLLASLGQLARAGVLAQLYGYSNTGCTPQIAEQGLVQPNTKDSACNKFTNAVYSVNLHFQENKDKCSST